MPPRKTKPNPDTPNDVPHTLLMPPDGVVEFHPVTTRTQVLPFERLTWENYERLLCRLASLEAKIEHCARYGKQGQSQQGIDIYARRVNAKYSCWQAKNRRSFKATDLTRAVNKFLIGSWATRSDSFVLCIGSAISDAALQDQVELQFSRLNELGIKFVAMGCDELTTALRSHPDLIDDFFGRQWVVELLGNDVARALSKRLPGDKSALLRSKLSRIYDHRSRMLDPGPAIATQGSAVKDVRERFVPPDVSSSDPFSEPQLNTMEDLQADGASFQPEAVDDWPEQEESGPHDRRRNAERVTRRDAPSEDTRIPLEDWLSSEFPRALILGGAGLGKSTALRCIALDILMPSKVFSALSARLADRIPVLIPFALWTRLGTREGSEISIQEVVRRTYGPHLPGEDFEALVTDALEDKRLLLLIDGLDEYADEQSARTTLLTLETFARTHDVPIIATGRPAGVKKLELSGDWKLARIAELSNSQQRMLAVRVLREAHFGDGVVPTATFTVEQRANAFFQDLDATSRLRLLAGVPLLLTGLLSITLRQAALPRSKFHLFEQLVTLLLETHPSRRKTAASEMGPRGGAFGAEDVRRESLSRLAFEVQRRGDDAGISRTEASKIVEAFLSDQGGLGWSTQKARDGARELTSAGSETSGLLVERSPNELTFCHASFREHLAGLELASWPLEEQVLFVRKECNDSRWRGPILTLIQKLTRPQEHQLLLREILNAVPEAADTLSVNLLLAEAAFSIPNLAAGIAVELSRRALDQIEDSGGFAEAAELLTLALNGPREGPVGQQITSRLRRWWPCTSTWRHEAYSSLLSWPKTFEVRRALWLGLQDEEPRNRWSASEAFAEYAGGEVRALQDLQELSSNSSRSHVVASALRAMVRGWGDDPSVGTRLESALDSSALSIRAVAAIELCRRGIRSDEVRKALIEVIDDRRRFFDKSLEDAVTDALAQGWPNDDEIVSECLKSVRHGVGRRTISYDVAPRLMVRSSPDHPMVREWLRELFHEKEMRSFALRGISEDVQKLIQRDSELKDCAESWLFSDPKRIYDYESMGIASAIHTERAKAYLLGCLKSKESYRYWETLALLDGWGMTDPDVAETLKASLFAGAAHRAEMASFIPQIVADNDEACSILDQIAAEQPIVRPDFLIRGYAALATRPSSRHIVDRVIDAFSRDSSIDLGATELIETCFDDERVKSFAVASLATANAPLSAIGKCYAHDPTVREALLGRLNPLPVRLRRMIAVRAMEKPEDSALYPVLESYDAEYDVHARCRAAIGLARYAATNMELRTGTTRRFERELRSIGPYMDERRVAAMGGLLAIGAFEAFANAKESDSKPLCVHVVHNYRDIEPILELLAEEWGTVEACLGDSVVERFARFGTTGVTFNWNELASHVHKSSVATTRFTEFCIGWTAPLTAGSLEVVARIMPRSGDLLNLCSRVLLSSASSSNHNAYEAMRAKLAAVRILASTFEARSVMVDLFEKCATEESEGAGFAGLAVVAPDSAFITTELERQRLGRGHGWPWFAMMALCSAQANVDDFVRHLVHYSRRSVLSIWDTPRTTLEMILVRFRRDSDAQQALVEEVQRSEHPSLIATLAALSRMRDVWVAPVAGLLSDLRDKESRRKGTPRFGLDIVANRYVPVSHALR